VNFDRLKRTALQLHPD